MWHMGECSMTNYVCYDSMAQVFLYCLLTVIYLGVGCEVYKNNANTLDATVVQETDTVLSLIYYYYSPSSSQADGASAVAATVTTTPTEAPVSVVVEAATTTVAASIQVMKTTPETLLCEVPHSILGWGAKLT